MVRSDTSAVLSSFLERIEEMNIQLKELVKSYRTRYSGFVTIPPVEAKAIAFIHLEEPRDTWNVVRLTRKFLSGSGLIDRPCTFYLRMSCREQIKFIIETAKAAESIPVLIYGYPGTGKSLTTYYAAGILAVEFCVFWVHMRWDGMNSPQVCDCVILEEGKQYSFRADPHKIAWWLADGKSIGTHKELLIIDGLSENTHFRQVHQASLAWLRAREETRGLIHVSIMNSAGQSHNRSTWNLFRRK
jgi:hypothetical protein